MILAPTLSDIDANRAGRITGRQRLGLLRGVAALLVMTGVGLVITVALGPNLGGAFEHGGFFGGMVVSLFLLLCLVVTVVAGSGVVVSLADTAVGRARSVSGAPTLRRQGVRRNALLPSSFTFPGQYRYKVMVGDKEFEIDPKVADQLGRDTRKIRVYFAALSGTLLSFEPLGSTPDG